MIKRSLNEKMIINTNNINYINNNKNNNVQEKGNTVKFKSRSTNKKYNKKEEIKQLEVIIEKKYINYNLDFIYRREKYSLHNLLSNFLISKLKKLISKKISVDYNLIHIYYLDKEITNDKLNVYELIKKNRIKIFEVKKEFPLNKNVISFNTNIHLLYKIKCKGIQNINDFLEKIEIFFKERFLDKHYSCEPLGGNTYLVGFSCEDLRFQFKRYMMVIKKLDINYKNISYQFLPVDKNEILKPKLTTLSPKFRNSHNSILINKGLYMTQEEMNKTNEKED